MLIRDLNSKWFLVWKNLQLLWLGSDLERSLTLLMPTNIRHQLMAAFRTNQLSSMLQTACTVYNMMLFHITIPRQPCQLRLLLKVLKNSLQKGKTSLALYLDSSYQLDSYFIVFCYYSKKSASRAATAQSQTKTEMFKSSIFKFAWYYKTDWYWQLLINLL